MPTHLRKTFLLVTDPQRSVLSALDGNQSDVIAYTPYGYCPFERGFLASLGFNGELPDPVTGHFHLGKGYRQFNPVLMRFNSPDSWSPFGEGGVNAYAYCAGDPVNRLDPTGHVLEKLGSFLRKNVRIGAAKPLKTTPENVVSSTSNVSRLTGSYKQPYLPSEKPRAELRPNELSDEVNYNAASSNSTATTPKSQTASTRPQASVGNLSASDITRSRLLNRRTKSLGHISDDFNEYLDGFYFAKNVGPDGGFFTSQFAANPRSTHARLYAAIASEAIAFPTPQIQRIIRTGGQK